MRFGMGFGSPEQQYDEILLPPMDDPKISPIAPHLVDSVNTSPDGFAYADFLRNRAVWQAGQEGQGLTGQMKQDKK